MIPNPTYFDGKLCHQYTHITTTALGITTRLIDSGFRMTAAWYHVEGGSTISLRLQVGRDVA